MIPLYKPHMPELPELDSILHSGQLASGEYTKKYEEMLSAFIGVGKGLVFTTNSFEMSISVACSLLGIHAGDEVIASPMACLGSTQPYAVKEIQVRWADIDPATGTLCPDSVRANISSKTKAIVHNHFCGFPGYVDEINAIGCEYGIPVIDDGIECFGSEYKGKKAGNWGTDITVFSFSMVRFPNTIDGGAIIVKNKDLQAKTALIRDCGIDRSIFRDANGEISPACDIKLRGYSATMSNVNAYIGIRQMEEAESVLEKQRKQAKSWDSIFVERPEKVITRNEVYPNYWVYGVLSENKTDFISEFREKGYYASGVHINNNIYSLFNDHRDLKGVNEFYSKFVALPCGWWMEEKNKLL